MLPVIGGANAVNLTILGNGDTIQRDTNAYQRRLIEVAGGIFADTGSDDSAKRLR